MGFVSLRGVRPVAVAGVLLALVLAAGARIGAQGQQAPAPAAQAAATPRGRAPIDLTGYWVSIVNEDWRWRMVTPPKGDVASVPLNAEGTKVANAWDPATDGSCLAYGAAGLMRIPTRLNITWQDDRAIKIETDAGQQTRVLRFDAGTPPAQRSLQGYSVAQWEPAPQPGRGGGAPQVPKFGNLKVSTTNLTAGWLRKNGVPYSENAIVTEWYDLHRDPSGTWLVVSTEVKDPLYLTVPFITSTHFKKLPDNAPWKPEACSSR